MAAALTRSLRSAYGPGRPIPPPGEEPPAAIPEDGLGMGALPALWDRIVAGSTRLATPGMIGHMDTAPHPAAALTDALVSALNNNLLFRELSPFASRIEELLIDDLSRRLGMPDTTTGTFCAGGSLANLTALFAACGGFASVDGRSDTALIVPDSAHTSIGKAAAVLGIPSARVHKIAGDDAGRLQLDALAAALAASAARRKIVVGVLGGTVTGAVDALADMAEICQSYDAWFHVDAVYGGALAFSHRFRYFLDGLAAADSIALGPQKWMYVPRLSAVVLMRDGSKFDEALAVTLPYSATGEDHRGRWGLQGSRRADAVTLWTTLQILGARRLGEMIDGSIDLTRKFHALLADHPRADPVHAPDLNLQAFRWGASDRDGSRLAELHRRLTDAGQAWVSLSRWGDEAVFRAVLLNPATNESDLRFLLDHLSGLASQT